MNRFSNYLLSKTIDLLVTIDYPALSSVEQSKKLHGRAFMLISALFGTIDAIHFSVCH